MKNNSYKDQKHNDKVVVDLASPVGTKNPTKHTFEELLKGSYISHFVKLADGSSKAVWKPVARPFMSFEEGYEWLVEHAQATWTNVIDCWGTFHGGCTGTPMWLIEKHKPQFDAKAFIAHHFNTDALGNILSPRIVKKA